MNTPPAMLYPELLAPFDMHAIMRDGQPRSRRGRLEAVALAP